MSIDFSCPSCGKWLQAPAIAAGKKAKCQGCGHHFLVPESSSRPTADEHRQHDRAASSAVKLPPIPTHSPPLDHHAMDDAPSMAYVMADGDPPPPVNHESTKPCPYCGEQVLAVARKCRYCHETLNPAPQTPAAIDSHPQYPPQPQGASYGDLGSAAAIGMLLSWALRNRVDVERVVTAAAGSPIAQQATGAVVRQINQSTPVRFRPRKNRIANWALTISLLAFALTLVPYAAPLAVLLSLAGLGLAIVAALVGVMHGMGLLRAIAAAGICLLAWASLIVFALF